MSVVIVGGNERMICQYKSICKAFKFDVKIFVDMTNDLKSKIGCPDLLILFTNTVSHKMVLCAKAQANKTNTKIVHSKSSSSSALKSIFTELACQ